VVERPTVVLDTHALIWHLSKPVKLGKEARRRLRLVDQGKAHALIPAIVVVELSLLREAGRLVIGPVEVDALVTANPAFRVLPLDLDQATEFALLDAVADPFDRLIIAAARAAKATLLSADHAIAASGLVEVRWE
jgi:PIN domain nuclease of toxin-antitoxin system